MIRIVYVVEDEAAIRRSIRLMLGVKGHTVTLFNSGAALLDALDGLRPGVLLIDVRLPEFDGIELLSRLRARRCTFPAIVMTGHGEPAIALAALRGGVISFLEKPFAKDSICQSLRAAFLSLEDPPGYAKYLESSSKALERLSECERALLEGLADGGADGEIAQRLKLPSAEFEMCRSHMLEKLGVKAVNDALACIFASRALRAEHGNFT